MTPECLNVQCVYGPSHLPLLEHCLIPALTVASERRVRLMTINFDPGSDARVESRRLDGIEVEDVPNVQDGITGFAANHNRLFLRQNGAQEFVVINPDCIPEPGAIDALLSRRRAAGGGVAIVEGRQWPMEHPKEYHPVSLQTPWASLAFALIEPDFYREVGGMDEIYFLYLEDVDLSWRAWLSGRSVLYEPRAAAMHFSGGPFYRTDLVSPEAYLSLRNFLVISRKFFGIEGEERAVRMLKCHPDQELATIALDEYRQRLKEQVRPLDPTPRHPLVKIVGLNQFHEWSRA